MATKKLSKTDWQAYFDQQSKHLDLKEVTILIGGLELGLQSEVDHVALDSISYDHADDAIEISSDAIHHRIAGPHDLFVEEDAYGALTEVTMTDRDGREQIVQLASSLAPPVHW